MSFFLLRVVIFGLDDSSLPELEAGFSVQPNLFRSPVYKLWRVKSYFLIVYIIE